jgi:chromate transporter
VAGVNWPDVWSLFGLMFQLSFLAIGGGNAVLPEMQRQVTVVLPWMSPHQFAALFALAQAAPGPNFLITTLVGYQVAGLAGAASATIGVLIPPCLLSYGMGALWQRFRGAHWRQVVQWGITPITCGLIIAAATLLTKATIHGLLTAAIVAPATVILLVSKLHPLVVLAAGALAGVLLG